jgi:hypothetical protein
MRVQIQGHKDEHKVDTDKEPKVDLWIDCAKIWFSHLSRTSGHQAMLLHRHNPYVNKDGISLSFIAKPWNLLFVTQTSNLFDSRSGTTNVRNTHHWKAIFLNLENR